MTPINRESKTSVHFGINFLLAGPWGHEKGTLLEFQKALLDGGLEFSQTAARPAGFSLSRSDPSSLQVILETPGPQVHTMQIIAANPQYDVEMFAKEALAATSAYQKTWRLPQYQILSTGGCIRHLYSAHVHAFQYLWEERLGQSPQDFALLGRRPVAGGGLRLSIPPHQKEGGQPVSIEIRIESFLRESQKLFVETVFTWPQPRVVAEGKDFDCQTHLREVESFAAEQVWDFIVKQKNPGQ
ncbi:MAG: hypothetical protein FJ263_08430 [Planctomycetes bacterium]|nr:hypothetical protein [Planctomycetota bacterium]